MKNTSTNKTEAALETQRVNTETQEKQRVAYVVVRAGNRVSEREYPTDKVQPAIDECNFWKKVAVDHSYGEPVEIVLYNPKLHRVW